MQKKAQHDPSESSVTTKKRTQDPEAQVIAQRNSSKPKLPQPSPYESSKEALDLYKGIGGQ